ncbi:MAG: anti-sigma factor antagonist [Candidatus Latescibacteria bacterium]|nr:anti-sigma factor antagonist [bacterium]MBD3425032.1 anti-sigma factor antagonist [Candidatus Latescibacterota bacterium]
MVKDPIKKKQQFVLKIQADENNLHEIRDFISDICWRIGFSQRETNNTKLAVDEACTNIIKHAYEGRAGEVEVRVEAEPRRIDINLFDQGRSFEWSDVKDPDLDEYVKMGKKGGLGIYLMNQLMDELDYTASPSGNKLHMSKIASEEMEERKPLFVSIKPKWTQTLRFKFFMRATAGLFMLMLLIWIFQYINQSNEIESSRSKEWMRIRNIAYTLEDRSENALVRNDPYHPEYRKVGEYIHETSVNNPEIAYMRVINREGTIVSSSNVNEFEEDYIPPEGGVEVNTAGSWIYRESEGVPVRELHLPVLLSEKDSGKTVNMGRVVVGVSVERLAGGIEDNRLRTGLIMIGVFFIGVGLIYLLISIFVKPIQTLTDGVRAIGEGSLHDELEVSGPEEIGAIARAFNEISAKFRKAQENIVEQERIYKEMQVAQEIQHSLLPRQVPEVSGYDIASYYKAAKEVGGDYYDFMNVDNDTLGVVVADVSGKGVPGSLVMTMIRTAMRMEARGNHSAADVMSRMNEFVMDDMKKGMFVTVFYVILDSRNRVISYSSAGHNPMILFRAETRETYFLNPRGFPVGINLPDDRLFKKSIDVEKIKLKKDDMLIIYTDGVTEAMNESREQYGEERLLSLIRENGTKPPQEFIDALNEDISRFTGNEPQNDDITVVSIKEKYMADDVLSSLRKKLIDLVRIDGLTVTEACRKMNVSPSTYYRYKKRLELMGERGLKNKSLRSEHDIRRLSNEQRKNLLEIIEDNPRYGPKRISDRINENRGDGDYVSPSLIYEELKRMRLNTFEKRLEYLRRNNMISREQFEEIRSGGTLPLEHAAPTEEVDQVDLSAGEEERGEKMAEERPPVDEEEEALPAGREEEEEEEYSIVTIEESSYSDDIILLKVSGHLDSSSTARLEEALRKLHREDGARNLIVDLEDVSYISSGGWGLFVGRVKSLREKKADVVLVGMNPEVYDVFELLGFQDILMQYQTLEEASDYLSIPFSRREKKFKKEPSRKKQPGKKVSDRERAAQGIESPLKISVGSVGEQGEIRILELEGIVDTVSCADMRDILEGLIEQGILRIIVDMSRIEYVSSAGWGVFAGVIEELRNRGGDIKIFGMDVEVYRIFKLLEFDKVLSSFNIMAEALQDFDTFEGEAAVQTAEPAVDKKQELEDISFEYEVRNLDGSGAVISPEGAIDASTTDRFDLVIEETAADDIAFLIIDLSGVVYVSSGGWGVMAKYANQLSCEGIELVLSGMSQALVKIYRDLGFEPLIGNFVDMDKAVEYFEKGSSGKAEPEEADVEDEAEKGSGEEAGEKEGVSRFEKEEGDDRIGLSSGITGEGKLEDVSARGTAEEDSEGWTGKAGDDAQPGELNLERDKVDSLEDKDSKIRDIGWEDYGRKLLRRNRNDRNKGGK